MAFFKKLLAFLRKMIAFFKKKKENAIDALSAEQGAADAKEKSGDSMDAAEPITVSGENRRGLTHATALVRPHVTEKATDLSGRGVYVFDIHQHANKMHVREAVEKLYKVKPTKVNIVNRKAKIMRNPRTGQTQVKQKGSKKALVYLKQGDKIEFV